MRSLGSLRNLVFFEKIKKFEKFERSERLERLARFDRLERLEDLKNLEKAERKGATRAKPPCQEDEASEMIKTAQKEYHKNILECFMRM